MNEKFTTMETRVASLEDPDNSQSMMTMHVDEFHMLQEDQNKRRAVAAEFHDDTSEKEVE